MRVCDASSELGVPKSKCSSISNLTSRNRPLSSIRIGRLGGTITSSGLHHGGWGACWDQCSTAGLPERKERYGPDGTAYGSDRGQTSFARRERGVADRRDEQRDE